MWLGHPHTGLLPGTYNLLPAVLLGDIAASYPLLNSLPSVNPPLTPRALRQSHLCRPPIAAVTASQQQPPPHRPTLCPTEASSGGFELSAVVVGATGADALEKVGKKAAYGHAEPRMCHLVDLVKSPHSTTPSPYPAPH